MRRVGDIGCAFGFVREVLLFGVAFCEITSFDDEWKPIDVKLVSAGDVFELKPCEREECERPRWARALPGK